MTYRREIDGLRAVAVLPILLFHAGSHLVTGGFVGVDVFFVISGYLITSLILAERTQTGGFSLLDFYERRARRILPALFAVLLACLPFAWFWMLPYQLKEFAQSLVGVASFASNVLFWKQSGYFDASAELKPLLHTWSLAIEEQYYVLFPLLVGAVWRWGRRGLGFAFLALGAASLGWAEFAGPRDPTGAFYLLPARAWELLLGAAIPLTQRADAQDAGAATRQVLSLAGLAMIGAALFGFDSHTPSPGLLTLIPTLGAALVIRFADRHTLAGRLLGHPVPVAVGLISYSLYLWHQPILAFHKLHTGHPELSPWFLLPYLALSFGLAFLSFRWIETPLRSRATVGRRGVFVLALAGIAGFALLGWQGHRTQGFLAAKLASVPADRRGLLVQVDRELKARTAIAEAHLPTLLQPRFAGDGREPAHAAGAPATNIVIVGDSLAGDLAVALSEHAALFPGHRFRLLQTRTECLSASRPAAAAEAGRSTSDCASALDNLLRSALLAQADRIVLTGLWTTEADPTALASLLDRLEAARPGRLRVMGSAGFLDIPSLSFKLAMSDRTPSQDEVDRLVARSRRAKFDEGNKTMAALAAQRNLPYLDRHRLYCDTAQQHCRILSLDGGSLIWDNAHLTPLGMRVTAEQVAEQGWLR